MGPTVIRVAVTLMLVVSLTGCGINNIPQLDEKAKAGWAQVENQYQRRADLIPNLVATVKGFAAQEKDVLIAVTEARSKVGQMKLDANALSDPAQLQAFDAAQGELSSALSRLMVVVEKYPDLKSNQNFLTLQSQLEGTENRIAVARKDYIESVSAYNSEIRTFPGRIWHSLLYNELQVRATFEATTEDAEEAPKVEF